MINKFANLYWSSDYKSGIDGLTRQSLRSIQQLHELRQLVFNYMNYFHSNSDYLNKLSIESFPLESAFRNYTPNNKSTISPPKSNAFRRISDNIRARTISQSERSLNKIKSIDLNKDSIKDKDEPISSTTAYEVYVRNASEESHTLMNLAAAIDREVLERITSFIKLYEPQVRRTLDEFSDIFTDYELTYKEVEKLKLEYDEYLRLREFSETDQRQNKEEPIELVEKEMVPADVKVVEAETEPDEISRPSSSSEVSVESEFDFPLQIGPIKVSNASQFSLFLRHPIQAISTIKRKIPIPGHRNEIFNSDQLCNYLVKNRPFGLDPTRLNLEKVGQGLVDLKLLVGTGLLGARKFKSEGMWFEWSDLAIFVSEYGEDNGVSDQQKQKSTLTSQQKLPKLVIDESAAKAMNNMAQNASKKVNGMFKNVRLSLLKNNSSDHLIEIEQKYNESYMELQDLKHFLDLEISNKSQTLERFEKTKIELVYQSLTKLSEILYHYSLSSTTRLHSVASEFITNINRPENYQRDFDKLMDDFSTGIYFPSIISPDNLTKKHYSTNQSNNNYQNLKLQFNLYKDIPLQPLLLQSEHNTNKLLSLSSIPQFLHKIIKLIEQKKEEEENIDISEAWLTPMDHQNYWIIKESIVKVVNNYEPNKDLDKSNETEIHKDILEEIFNVLSVRSSFKIVNFLKNWLLEISDSLIPCMIFDSIINNYKAYSTAEENSSDKEFRINETVKLLSSIPRSNLSSLIYILEHISLVFSLHRIPCYENSDVLIEELKRQSTGNSLKEVVSSLNSMDIIGAIPFVHLILRPSTVKHSSGFKPPLSIYNILLTDLLDINVRLKLFIALVTKEKNYKSKKENEKIGLQVKKLSLHQQQLPDRSITQQKNSTTKTIVNHTVPKSPRPLSGENFALRPFRTRATPNPSPNSSPRHTPKSSFDLNANNGEDLKLRKRGDSNPIEVRPRSSSSTFLTPIDVEFEK